MHLALLVAKKGGEAFFHGHARHRADRIRKWVDDHAFLSVFIPAILPPPMPFKAFVAAEGVFQVPLRTFVLALLLGRGLRYFAEGILAIRYGDAVGRALAGAQAGVRDWICGALRGVVIWGRTLGAAPHKKK